MKLCLLLTCFLFIGAIYAQEPDTSTIEMQRTQINPEEIHSYVEEPPVFPGGNSALQSFLKEQLVYPATALENDIEGSCYVKFVIDENGKVLNPKIMRGFPDCDACNKEAIRLVSTMPDWTPGKNGGKAVKSYYVLKIPFRLPG